jgi:uncharacterized repeat protein (TIGR01451 family)
MKFLNGICSWKNITSLIMLMLVLLPDISLAAVWYTDGGVSSSGDGASLVQAFEITQEGIRWNVVVCFSTLLLMGMGAFTLAGFTRGKGNLKGRRMRNSDAGFTLIEMCVVLSTMFAGALLTSIYDHRDDSLINQHLSQVFVANEIGLPEWVSNPDLDSLASYLETENANGNTVIPVSGNPIIEIEYVASGGACGESAVSSGGFIIRFNENDCRSGTETYFAKVDSEWRIVSSSSNVSIDSVSKSALPSEWQSMFIECPVYHHVATSGSDTIGDGSKASPFATIQHGIDTADNEDVVLVHEGTYAENINFNGKNITVESTDGAEKTVIDGGKKDSVVQFVNGENSNAVLDGFTITNGTGTLTVPTGGASGRTHGGGIWVYNGSSPTLRNLIVTGNSGNHGGGIGTWTNSNPYIENVLLTNNDSWWCSLGCWRNSNPKLVNVTIADNNGCGLWIDGSRPELTNSILWNNISNKVTEVIFYGGSNAVTFSHSVVRDGINGIKSYGSSGVNASDTVNWLDGNLDVAPAFVGNGDYHLADNSPLLDKGTATGAPTEDIEGMLRQHSAGVRPDMGAYEKTALNFEQRRILRTINDVGYAYVIIGLHVDNYQPEGYYDSPEGVSDQRARVAEAQKLFVDSLSAFTSPMTRRLRAPVLKLNIQEFLDSVDTFTTVPQLFMKINRVLFERIIEHPLMTNMWLNVADSVSLSKSTEIVGAKTVWNEKDKDGNYLTGKGQYVVVLDTGVDGSKLGTNKVAKEACFSSQGSYLDGNNSVNIHSRCVVGTQDGADIYGIKKMGLDSAKPCGGDDGLNSMRCAHGTEVAGIIAANININENNQNVFIGGVANEAQIIAIKIAGKPEDSGKPLFTIASQQEALDYVVTLNNVLPYKGKIAAVNMSLNSSDFSSEFCDDDLRKPSIDNLYSLGIATIISSGNNNEKNKLAKPACISSAISVGATGCGNGTACEDNDSTNIGNEEVGRWWDDGKQKGSNSAKILDLLAPGVKITTTDVDYPTVEDSGTSMAAPHVAGAWAILKQKKSDATVEEILEALVVTGVQIKQEYKIGDDTFSRIKPRIQIDRALDALNYSNYMGITRLDADDGDTLVEQIEDEFPSPFSLENVCTEYTSSGAATVEMTLKYLVDDSPTQTEIYNGQSCGNDMTAEQVKDALNEEVHKSEYLVGTEYAYNYGHLAYDSEDSALKAIVYWMDYEPPGGKHAPVLVPIGNTYNQTWRVIRGAVTSEATYKEDWNWSSNTSAGLTGVTIYGFLVNNPTILSSKLGYYEYQTLVEFQSSYLPINVDNKYHVVVEPPLGNTEAAEAALDNVELKYAEPVPNVALRDFLAAQPSTLRKRTRDSQDQRNLVAMVKNAIPGSLLVNPLFKPLIMTAEYARVFKIDNLNTGNQYAIFALSPNNDNTATVLVKIDSTNGAFVSATWTASGQTYPTVSLADAEQIAIQSANGNIQQIRRVWSNRLETSNFHFSYEVTFESGKVIYVNSKGEVIIEGVYSSFGHIHDKFGKPIAGVTVQVVGHKTTTTNSIGYWEINGLTEGEYTLIASKTGYQFGEPQDFAVGNDILRTEVKFKKPPVSLLRITAIPQPRVVKQGQDIDYRITVINAGDATITGVVLTDELPADTSLISVASIDGNPCETNATSVNCELADLTPGATATVNLAINNTQAATLINMAMVHSNEYPADLAKTWTEVKPYLSVSVEATPEPVLPGSLLHYTQEIDLNHYAPITTATGIKLVSRLPHGVELQSINSDYASCDVSNLPTIACDVSDLSIENADNVSHVSINFDVMLKDLGLLLLTLESTLTASEYPPHNVRTSTEVNVGDAEVDMVFVLDVTNSMRGEINGVIRAVKKLLTEVDKTTWPVIALVTFRDDVTVKAVTQDSDLLAKAVDNIHVSGGGTCPEASVEALEIAIKHTKAGGTILLATDASPYNNADIEGLMTRLLNKGIRLNAIITGDCTMTDSWNVIPFEDE